MNRHHEALRKHVDELLSKDDVYAVGLGEKISGGKRTGKRAIICSIKKKKQRIAAGQRIPAVIDGIPTDIIEIGDRPVKFPAYQDKQRPVVPGCSVGHYAITAGTIGGFVEVDGEVMILSNNHVLADENNAKLGDAILQPGDHDGGKATDQIGVLWNYVSLTFTNQTEPTPPPVWENDPTPPPAPPVPEPDPTPPAPPEDEDDSDCKIANIFTTVLNKVASIFGRETRLKAVRPAKVEAAPQEVTKQAIIRNKIDAALCKLDDGIPFVTNYLTYYSGVKGVNELATVGTPVHKLGRTTGHTLGTITQTNVTVDVGYDGGTVRFENQIAVVAADGGQFSAGGDSGSIIVDEYDNAVALLFAGNNTTTFANPIDEVMSSLNITKFVEKN